MKVFLVYPYSRTTKRQLQEPGWMPLSFSYIAAVLRSAGHEVKIFDRYAEQFRHGNVQDDVDRAMLKQVRSFRPDMIGFNTVTPLIYDLVHCIELVEKEYEGIMIAGGHHVSALPELTLQRLPRLNGVVVGEGEYALRELAGGADPEKIPGAWWRIGEDTKFTPPQQIKELDQLPYPAIDLLDMEFYCQSGRKMIKGHQLSAVSMLTARGCPYSCYFCTESMTYGKGVRFHSPEYVLNNLQQVVDNYAVDGTYFLDNDFLVDEERAARICQGMIDAGLHKRLKFAIQARANRINEQVIALLKQAGCVLVEIGVESTNQNELDWMKKKSNIALNKKAIAICRKGGIAAHAYMMTGIEGETLADLDRKLEWLKQSKPHTFSLHRLQIYPGTKLYKEKGNNYFEKNLWTKEAVDNYFRKDHLSSISEDEYKDWFNKHYRPYQLKMWRLNTLKSNSVGKLLAVVINRLKN